MLVFFVLLTHDLTLARGSLPSHRLPCRPSLVFDDCPVLCQPAEDTRLDWEAGGPAVCFLWSHRDLSSAHGGALPAQSPLALLACDFRPGSCGSTGPGASLGLPRPCNACLPARAREWRRVWRRPFLLCSPGLMTVPAPARAQGQMTVRVDGPPWPRGRRLARPRAARLVAAPTWTDCRHARPWRCSRPPASSSFSLHSLRQQRKHHLQNRDGLAGRAGAASWSALQAITAWPGLGRRAGARGSAELAGRILLLLYSFSGSARAGLHSARESTGCDMSSISCS